MKKNNLQPWYFLLATLLMAGMAIYGFFTRQWILSLGALAGMFMMIFMFTSHKEKSYQLYMDIMTGLMLAVALYGVISGVWILTAAALPSVYMIRMMKKMPVFKN